MPITHKERAAMKDHVIRDLKDLLQDTENLISTTSNEVSLPDLLEDLHKHHQAVQTTFIQTNLISDGLVPALKTDPNLINPWGVAFSPTSPFWISDNGTGLASVDKVNGGTVTVNAIPPVTIPPS